jgi:DNA sulfur modification protein DndB
MALFSIGVDTFSYSFPVIRGIQSGREYYVTMVPLKLIPKIFLFNEKVLPPNLLSQRALNKSRIPIITKYLIEHPRDYVFSALTASIDGPVNFQPVPQDKKNSKIGQLFVPVESRFLINDGQHRKAAIEMALRERPELGYETISVVLFIDAGLKRSQQMFSDLNKYAVRPSTSLGILYDHRDEFSQMIQRVIEKTTIFRDNIEMGKSSISNRSTKLFTLSSVYRANRALIGKERKDSHVEKEDDEIAATYWNEITQHIQEWKQFLRKAITSSELRYKTIIVHGIALHALGILGSTLIREYPSSWSEKLKHLDGVDWERTNKEWEGRAMIGGRLNKSYSNTILTSNLLKIKLGIALSEREQDYEKMRNLQEKEVNENVN